MILIILKFGELLLLISPRILNALRSFIKHTKECFITEISNVKRPKPNLYGEDFLILRFLFFAEGNSVHIHLPNLKP